MSEMNLTKWQECFAANRSFPPAENRLFVGIPLLIGNTIAVSANATLLLILIKSWSILGSNKFNLLILHLAAAHCFYESVNFVSSIPSLLASGPIYSNDVIQTATAFFNTPPATTVLWMNTLIALERFSYFVIPNLHKFMNRSYIRQALPLALWILAHAMSIFSEIHGCKKRFNQWNMVYTFDCSYCKLTDTLTILDLMTGMSQTLPIILVVCYVITFMQIFNIKFIRPTGNETALRNTNAEIKVVNITTLGPFLAIQFFVICLCQWFSSSMFMLGIKVFGPGNIAALLANIASVLNGLVNPILLFTFNSVIQTQLFHIFQWKSKSDRVGTIVTISDRS